MILTGNFSTDPIFYVYLHRRLDTGEVFYVGKGKAKRAWSKSARNKHWRHIVQKCGYSVEIFKDGLTELEAFNLEIETIQTFKNLVNLTIGGNTSSGYRHTEETKQIQSEITKKRIEQNPEYAEMIMENLRALHEKQRNDPDYKIEMSKRASLIWEQTPEDVRIKQIEARCAWQKDPEKIKNSMLKRQKTYEDNPELLEIIAKKNSELWRNEEYRSRQLESRRIMFEKLKSEGRKVSSGSSKKVLVNGLYVFESILSFSEYVGSQAVVNMLKYFKEINGLSFAIVKGYIVEEFTGGVAIEFSGQEILPVFTNFYSYRTPVIRSDGVLFFSATSAAVALGKEPGKPAQTTSEWILKLCRGHNNQTGLGYTWKIATPLEVESYVRGILCQDKY